MLLATVDPTLIVAVTGAIGSGVFGAWRAFKKTPVEAGAISVKSLLETLEYRDQEIKGLRERVDELEDEREADQTRIMDLERAVAALQGGS
jgi:hypothetical protein